MTTGLCMETPTWSKSWVTAMTKLGVHKLTLPLIWFMTGSKAKARGEKGLELA